MLFRQIDVFRVREQDVAELKVGARLDARRRLQIEDRLQTLDTRLDVGRTRRAEIFGQAEQREIPSVLRRRHFNISPYKRSQARRSLLYRLYPAELERGRTDALDAATQFTLGRWRDTHHTHAHTPRTRAHQAIAGDALSRACPCT